MKSWLLVGLDGGNPLGFLAAIGTLRTAALSVPPQQPSRKPWDWRMSWEETDGGWRPRLFLDSDREVDLVETLSNELELAGAADHGAFTLADNLTIDKATFAKLARAAAEVAGQTERRKADFLAAFGCEAIESPDGSKKGQIADTAFRTMSGAGHQHFLGTMRKLAADTSPAQLRKALTEPWLYDDAVEGHTMRWDPKDDTRRALRWSEPSGDPARRTTGCVWGANRLAIEALPLLPTVPVGVRLGTTGFTRASSWLWTWPIWEGRASLDVVRSLLALKLSQEERPNRTVLDAIGIREIYRCQRITQGRFRNFTVAAPA